MSGFCSEPRGSAGIHSWAMAAARRVVEEVLGTCRQTELLALRRSALPAAPVQSTRKSDLIAELAAECDTVANEQCIFGSVMATWTKSRRQGLWPTDDGCYQILPPGPLANCDPVAKAVR